MIIEVNKECLVSRRSHFKHHRANEVVVNVSALDDQEGFVQFVLAYNTRDICCEFCRDYSNVPNKPVREYIVAIEIIENSDAYVGHEAFKDGLYCGSCVEFIIHTDDKDKKYEGFVANEQNGFYSHLVVWTNGDLEYSTEI